MVFWGVEVQPGKPYVHSISEDDLEEKKTLRLSQATLGFEGKNKERVGVKCKVGEARIVEVVEEGVPSPSPAKPLKSGEDEPKPESKSAQKKRRKAEARAKANVEVEKKSESPATPGVAPPGGEESDDEDGFAKETPKKKQAVEGADGAATPGTAVTQSARKKRKSKNKEPQTPGAEATKTAEATPAVTPEPSKDEVKVVGKKENGKQNITEKTPAKASAIAQPAKDDVKVLAKKEKPKEKAIEKTPAKTPAKPSVATNGEMSPAPATNGTHSAADKKSAQKGTPAPVKKFPNGLEIHDVAMGKPDAKQAKAGKKVGMIYTGRLKSSGKIFDSNVGKKPFEFRLGVGEVIKGWDLGVSGMRVGDKRKLIIPAAMGYGTKGVAGSIPGNSVLEFDVELVNVK